MHITDSIGDLSVAIASAADVCMKPWKHAVVDQNTVDSKDSCIDEYIDLVLRIECRGIEGQRHPENDLELEIYRSGEDLNLTLSWFDKPERPILWQGQHSVWMDANSGKRCNSPDDGLQMEALARRLRALFVPLEDV